MPGSAVSHVGNVWTFEFEPESKNEHTYTIEVIATDHAGNSATESIDVLGVKTVKKH